MSKHRLRAGALALVLVLGLSCAQSDTGNMTQGDGAGAADMDMGTAEEGCFMGTPQSERELLNSCTDAERVLRPHRIPDRVWDGRGPLPPAP